jgi:hypothetical protein
MNQYHHLPLCQQEISTQHEGCEGGHHVNPQHVCLHVHAPQCKVRVTQLYLCTIYVYHLLEIPEQQGEMAACDSLNHYISHDPIFKSG